MLLSSLELRERQLAAGREIRAEQAAREAAAAQRLAAEQRAEAEQRAQRQAAEAQRAAQAAEAARPKWSPQQVADALVARERKIFERRRREAAQRKLANSPY